MTVFVTDTFVGADGTLLSAHAADSGATWTRHGSSDGGSDWAIASNRIRATGGGYCSYYTSPVPSSADYAVQADLVVLSLPALYYTNVQGRVATAADTAYVLGFTDAPGFKLTKLVAGAETTLGLEAITPVTSLARLEMLGTSIKGFRDGVQKFSVTDGVITAAGRAGVTKFWDSTTSTSIHLDNLMAEDFLSPASGPVRRATLMKRPVVYS